MDATQEQATDAEVDRIAKGLSPSHQSALLASGDIWQYHMPDGSKTRARNEMCNRPLGPLMERVWGAGGAYLYQRTDLGRRVAAYLSRSSGGE